MKTLIIVVCISLLFILAPLQPAPAQDPSSMEALLKAAGKATEEWLALVDEGRYGDSWENAAGLFKKAITKEQWIDMLKAVRPSFGDVIARTLLTVDYKTQMPGAPDGHYVIIRYRTAFKNKRESIETITPLLDEDGTWRVSGYNIQ